MNKKLHFNITIVPLFQHQDKKKRGRTYIQRKAEEITRGVKNTAVIRGKEKKKRNTGRRSESSQGDRGNAKER